MTVCERLGCGRTATWSDGQRYLCGPDAAVAAVFGRLQPIEAHIHPDTHHGQRRAS